MADLAIEDPCVIFALRHEARPFYRAFRPQQRFPGAPCRARFCGPAWLTVLILETGMGPELTNRALVWALGRPLLGNLPYQPKIVLSAGFSGALQSHYKVGDLILGTEVCDDRGNRWPTTWPRELPPGEWRPPLNRGRLLTTARVVGSPEEKTKLADQFEADAVDMECAVIARWCGDQGIPFGCLRAISDDVQTPLSPRLATLLSRARVSVPQLVSGLVVQPRLWPEMWQLAKNTRLAAANLALALGELLTLTLRWGKEL